jgi:hypothetical protein
VLHGVDSKGAALGLHLLAFLVVAAAPRVVVVPAQGVHDTSIEATIAEGARAAGLDVVSLRAAKQVEKLVSCPRSEVDCLLRMSALGDVDGAIAWRKTRAAGAVSVDVVVVSVEHKREERAKLADVEAVCRRAFAAPVVEAPPTTPPTSPTSPTPPTPPATPPPAPPVTTPQETPAPGVEPPTTTSTPGAPAEAELDVAAISLAAGGAVVALACITGAIVLDAGLSSDIERAKQRIAPRPDDFELRQGLFFGTLVGAGAGVVAAGIGGVRLATE